MSLSESHGNRKEGHEKMDGIVMHYNIVEEAHRTIEKVSEDSVNNGDNIKYIAMFIHTNTHLIASRTGRISAEERIIQMASIFADLLNEGIPSEVILEELAKQTVVVKVYKDLKGGT